MAAQRAQWNSRIGFILAASGSAVGLGNIWKFPYITGENGGGLFVLIYLVCIALVGVPIMMAEIMIGRAAQKQPVEAFRVLQGGRTGWSAVGWLGVFGGFIILSYYIVVAGWAMDFTLKSIANFSDPIHETAEQVATTYRATTPVDEMRATLAKTLSDKTSKDEIASIRRKAPPSTWKWHEKYTTALTAAGGTDEARSALFEDDLIRRKVLEAEALLPEIAAASSRHLQAATSKYYGMPDRKVRDEATTLKRRTVTFESVQASFLSIARNGWISTFWATIFMLITIIIVSGGIAGGIERTCRVLMPLLLVLILVMVVYGMFQSGFSEALSFVFKPDPHKLKASGVLEALGHAFFTLSLGMGAMITYGSYQRTKERLVSQSVTIAVLDTVIAMLACLMIFPITFTFGQNPDHGPGLVFMSMPLAFAEIGTGGLLLAILFFGLVVFAALTSSISLLEVVASYFIDALGWARMKAAWILGLAILAFGIPSAFSMDPEFAMADWEPGFGKNFFDTMDYLASNWMLPAGGLLIALYAGWAMPKRLRDAEVVGVAPALVTGWLFLVRWVTPALVIIVLMQKVGILDADEFFHGLFS